jgi:hypothetical protein
MTCDSVYDLSQISFLKGRKSLVMAGGRECKYALAFSALTNEIVPDDGQNT